MTRQLLAAWAILVWACVADGVPTLIGEAYFPHGHQHENRSFAQISGCRLRSDGKLLLVGDSRKERGLFLAGVAYTGGGTGLAVTLAPGSVRLHGLPNGASVDAEGLGGLSSSFLGDDVLVSGEPTSDGSGDAERWYDEAALLRFRPDGQFVERYALPSHWAHNSDVVLETTQGTRNNAGFEGLATTPAHGGLLYLANEQPLYQDAEQPVSVSEHLPVRIVEYHLDSGRLAHEREYRYNLNTARASLVAGQTAWLGVSDIAALNDSHILVMERAWDGRTDRIELYAANLSGAAPIQSCHSLAEASCASIAPAQKTLVFDLEKDYGVRPNNYEGLCWGPDLPDGRRVLLLVSDDNSNAAQNGTHFVALAWGAEGAQEGHPGGVVRWMPYVSVAVFLLAMVAAWVAVWSSGNRYSKLADASTEAEKGA